MTEIKALTGLMISSMTLLSAPFNGSGLGLEWNWVIIDKKRDDIARSQRIERIILIKK